MIFRAVRRAARSLAALVLGLALALGPAEIGFAHAHVISATPGPEAVLLTAPPSLTLEFDAALANSGNQIAFNAVVRDASGKPVTNLQRVILRYQPVGLSIGEDEVVAPASGSEARTSAFTLGLAGAWQLQVIVRRAGLDDVTATTQLTIAPAPGAEITPAATATPALLPPTTTAAASPSPLPTLAAPATPTIAASAASPVQSIAPGPAPSPAAETAGTGSPDLVLIVAGLAVLIVVLGLVAFVLRRPRG